MMLKTPDDLLREMKEKWRDRMRFAVFAVPPELLRGELVLISLKSELSAAARYHSAQTLQEVGVENLPEWMRERIGQDKAPYSIFTGADEIPIKAPFDRIAFAVFGADEAEFEAEMTGVEKRGARRFAGAELAAELDDPFLTELIGYDLNEGEKESLTTVKNS